MGTGRTPARRQQCVGDRRRTTGVVYLALLVLLAVVSMWAANAMRVGEVHGQRDAEEELLAIGRDFTHALQLYASATPAGLPRTPSALEDLLRDPRYPNMTRYLRRLPEDPLTGKPDWMLVRDVHGRIVGVHSASQLVPIRREGPAGQMPATGSNWRSYSEWVFWGLEANLTDRRLGQSLPQRDTTPRSGLTRGNGNE